MPVTKQWWFRARAGVVVALGAVVVVGCVSMFTNSVTIKGKVRLSDSPSGGHGGVSVVVGQLSTVSQSDGSFIIDAHFRAPRTMYADLSKAGYRDTLVPVVLRDDTTKSDSLVDLGTIVLRRITADTLSDNFNDGNADGWELDAGAQWRVESNELSAQCPDDQAQHWAKHHFATGSQFPDFRYSARTKHLAGRTGEAYGIGVLDAAGVRTCLLIARDGQYTLSRYDGSGWTEICPWTYSRSIDTLPGRWNRLELERTGGVLKVAVNDSLLGSYPSVATGNPTSVGLYCQGDLHVHYDDVSAVSW